jgi:hypothetical protein
MLFNRESKKIAISQSNYLPWKGYFDLISCVDEFVLYDDMQYTRRDWRNRNLIKTPDGKKWLTVPVKVKGKFYQKICETEIDGNNWVTSHWNSLERNYRRTSYFQEIITLLEPIFFSQNHKFLSELNFSLISKVCSYLGIETRITKSSNYDLNAERTARLSNICSQANAKVYVSGPSAKSYINLKVFEEAGIEVNWFDYNDYPTYSQLWGDFSHNVSILDLLFNCGKSSSQYMKFVN